MRLGLAELLVVAFTASLAAVGAPAIPSAGLVTMLIVLQAVSLDQYAAGGCTGVTCLRGRFMRGLVGQVVQHSRVAAVWAGHSGDHSCCWITSAAASVDYPCCYMLSCLAAVIHPLPLPVLTSCLRFVRPPPLPILTSCCYQLPCDLPFSRSPVPQTWL